MKVVIPAADLHKGGGCKALVDIARAMTVRGHDVEIVLPEGSSVHYELPCKLTVVPALTKSTIPYGDLVLPNYYTTFRPAFEAWPDRCVRISLGFEPLWSPERELALWTYRQDVPVVSISRWLDDRIYEHARRRSEIVSLGIDPAVFNASGSNPKRRKGEKPQVILYIARNPDVGYEFKGFRDFQQCMNIIKNEWSSPFIVHLICPERALPLPDIPHRIFFPKSEREMADLYRDADVFVSSSWFEAFSLPPLEAMACGTPVVTTNSGGVLDYCEHMENAYITQPKNPRALAEGICALLDDDLLSDKLIASGLRRASSMTARHFETRIGETLETIYLNQIARKSGKEKRT